MQKELSGLWIRRRDVVKALAEAAAEGDRSENAEYIYRKKELAGIDRRIRYLQKRLPELNVVRDVPSGDAVFFGAFVEVCDDKGESRTYRIVGPDEIDPKQAAISIDSPMARALLKKQVDGFSAASPLQTALTLVQMIPRSSLTDSLFAA